MLLLPAVVPALVLAAAQGGPPKQTQLPKDALKNARDAKIFRLPRVMLVPITTDVIPAPSKDVVYSIDKGFRKGWEESAKETKGRVYDLIPYDKTMAAIDKQLPPVNQVVYLEKNAFVRWDTGKMVLAAKSLGADFVAIPSLAEMTIAKDKDQVECRGYVDVFPMDKPYPVITRGWLGGQWNNLGIKTPYAVAREIARVDIPRRFYEDYSRTKWPSPK
ncbi:hypothetical protein EON79_21515 [bacterium]|nr:MAG: hypothetical protein EON79_21515 [bacterium]